jgi:hypothetical protein
MRHQTRTMLLTLLAGAGLAACQPSTTSTSAPPSALPLAADSAAPLSDAPPASDLPAAAAPPLAPPSDPSQAYAYADRAWAMSDAFGDSPPDYAFDDGGVTPWVWTASDNSICVAEAVPGGERYYYYEPGAAEPFYVQDADYGYSFNGRDLVAVYDHSGRSIPIGANAALAGRYLARGEALRQSATSAPHQAVAANSWQAQRGYIADQRTTWAQDAQSNPAWSAYHSQNQAAEQAHWAPEAARRETWAADTDARLGDQAKAQQERALAAPAVATPAAPEPGAHANLSPLANHPPAPAPGEAQRPPDVAAAQSPDRQVDNRPYSAPAASAPHAVETRPPPAIVEQRPAVSEPRAAEPPRPAVAAPPNVAPRPADTGRPNRRP